MNNGIFNSLFEGESKCLQVFSVVSRFQRRPYALPCLRTQSPTLECLALPIHLHIACPRFVVMPMTTSLTQGETKSRKISSNVVRSPHRSTVLRRLLSEY